MDKTRKLIIAQRELISNLILQLIITEPTTCSMRKEHNKIFGKQIKLQKRIAKLEKQIIENE
jgi:hypothetical protein